MSAPRYTLLPLLLAALAGGAGAAPAPPRAPASSATAPMRITSSPRVPAAPETRVQGYRIVIEKLQQAQNLSTEFSDDGKSRTTGRQLVYVYVAVHPPTPALARNIEGLDPRIVAYAAPETQVPFMSYAVEDTNPLVTGVWRGLLMAQEIELSVSRLQRLQGQLVVYPRARLVTLDFPLAGKLPQVQEAEGFRATLKQSRVQAGSLGVIVDTEWPPGISLTRLNPEAPDGITALTAAGSTLIPQRGGSSAGKHGENTVRTHTLTFTDVKEVPAKLRVQVMVRSGTPERIPFTLPDLVMPDALDLRAELDEESGWGLLQEGHPLYMDPGGTLAVPVRGAAPGAGRLLVGLAPREGQAWGPWRWVEAVPDERGQALLSHLRPGTYRVARVWLPGQDDTPRPALPPPSLDTPEVEITAARTVALPPLQPGGKP